MNDRSKGFSIIEIILVVAMLAVIGLISWRVWDANQQATPQDSATGQTQNEIKTTDDLDKTESSLDDTNIDEDFEQQLDAETNF